jgi:periplasmic protein TonB
MSDAAANRPPVADVSVTPPISARTAAIWSLSGHLIVILGAVLLARVSAPPAMPPSYSVELVAAPAGPRSLGAVAQGPSVEPAAMPTPPAPDPVPDVAPKPAPAAKTPVAPAPSVKKPVTPTRPATPTTPRAGGDAPVAGKTPAGGGPTGGRGRDVASVRVQGIAFPFPGYLENITRQIALNFKAQAGVALRAEVTFLIHRDGSVSDLRLLSRSGTYAFDLEAIGAVEAVGQRRSFGPLPAGFRDDVLPVVFSFDPRVLR